MDTHSPTTSSPPSSPSRRDVQCGTVVVDPGTGCGNASLLQMVSRLEGALSEVRMAQAQMQVEVLRLGQRVEATHHLVTAAEQSGSVVVRHDLPVSDGDGQFSQVFSARLDSLAADLQKECRRRQAGEAVVHKAVGSILRSGCISFRDRPGAGRSPPSAGSSPLPWGGSSSASDAVVQELLGDFEQLNSEDTVRQVAAEICEVFPSTQHGIKADSSSDASASASCRTREAYEELFVKKARCFEQAVNMIEVTAANVTKRLEAVISESSAAMRQEACDRAEAKAEIQRALQEIRTASDFASSGVLREPDRTPDGPFLRLHRKSDASGGVNTPASSARVTQLIAGTAGAPGGDAAGGASVGVPPQRSVSPYMPRSVSPQRMNSGVAIVTMSPAVEVVSRTDDMATVESKLIAARSSECLTIHGITAPPTKVSISSPPAGGDSSSMNNGVFRVSSQPQHMLQESAGYPRRP
jgi:hypothetical protein